MKILELINPPATVRAWIYRVVFLTAVIVVAVALAFGSEPETIIATASTVAATVTGTLAIVNTTTSK